MLRYILKSCVLLWLFTLLASCSSDKFLGTDEYLLTSVKLSSDNSEIDAPDYNLHVRQHPNSKWFGMFKVPLALYSVSSTDTTRKSNRFWQRIGEAPVIYNEQQTINSKNAISLALKDKGYLAAKVTTNVIKHPKKQRLKLHYKIHLGEPYIIKGISIVADDKQIDSILTAHSASSYLTIGMQCDASLLDKERTRITNLLHNNGYYKVLKNFIRFEIDTLQGPSAVNLTMIYAGKSIATDTTHVYDQYHINKVNIAVHNNSDVTDSICLVDNGFNIVYKNTHHHTFRPNLLRNNSHLLPNQMYCEQNVAKTYHSLANLDAIGYESIQLKEKDSALIDCDIHVIPKKINSLGVELEGTNTAGNLGVASNLTFTNRNLFNGAEVLTTKLKGAYEAITGLEGYSDQNYVEFGLETKISFPKLIHPFRLANKYKGTTSLSLQFDTQERPEFHRRVFTSLWNYQWTNKSGTVHHRLDLPCLNYVYMPWISKTFREEYLQSDNYRSALIRYAYENLLIFNFTYSHTYTSNANSATHPNPYIVPRHRARANPYQLNWSIESAGNILYALSRPLKLSNNTDLQYTIFDVAYAQYLKFDIDFSKHYLFDSQNKLAIHAVLGIAQPYGNSDIVPFEKRYFAGGANGIRGWSVRELGPGRYMGEDGKVDFINQTGNLKLLFSMEWRSNLFWKFNGAFFIDAGNIWTTRRYEVTGKGGQFQFKNFWKQIATSYGVGLRMNLDYFVLRFDMAMKAVNPAYDVSDKGYLPIIHPRFHRDFTFHFAVGLPF